MNEVHQARSLLASALSKTESAKEVSLLQRAMAALDEFLRKERTDDSRDALMRDPFRHRRTIGPEHLPGMVFE